MTRLTVMEIEDQHSRHSRAVHPARRMALVAIYSTGKPEVRRAP
jgi:hypothetical protein